MDSAYNYPIYHAIRKMRQHRLKHSDQWTLGKLIAAIEGTDAIKKKYAWINFDFAGCFPVQLMSWRGAYDELAIGFCAPTEGEQLTPERFLDILRQEIGKTEVGYKGGDFVMTADTPLWVDNYGQSNNTAVIGLEDTGHSLIIKTGTREY